MTGEAPHPMPFFPTDTIPVVVLAGYLGAGKTTLLNHVLRSPGSRIGVIMNEFGSIDIDSGLLAGQVDEPVSIAGGCLCCISDSTELDRALERLTDPGRHLDAIIIEASGVADPAVLRQLVRFSGVSGIRPGGVIDVIDVVEHERTVDIGGLPPRRYVAASLVVMNKIEQVDESTRRETIARIEARVRDSNPFVHMVHAVSGQIDPLLLFDTQDLTEPENELPLRSLIDSEHTEGEGHSHDHAHAVASSSAGAISPSRLVDLLEDPPVGVYRIKGCVAIASSRITRGYHINLVGRSIHIATSRHPPPTENALVAIGSQLDDTNATTRIAHAIEPIAKPDAAGLGRLQRYRRLSL